MISYRLQCPDDHVFDVWFNNSASYDTQVAAGLIECPVCGSVKLSKALMAPNIVLSRGSRGSSDTERDEPDSEMDEASSAQSGGAGPQGDSIHHIV